MHSLIHQLNHTLSSAEKTHSMKFFHQLGLNQSIDVGFAYYPQFWLRDQSPTLEQVLQEMIAQKVKLSKVKRTVLIVGGVQWMSTRHLDQIATTLANNELNDTLVIVKTLGAGFHQQIHGVHYLPLVTFCFS